MYRDPFQMDRTVTPVLRDDGTVYFQRVRKPISERVCEWTLGILWFAVAAVLVATVSM
jgi:hypothetical protein